MKTDKINKAGSELFKNKAAIALYNKMAGDSHIYQSGIDTQGKVFFAWLNGNIDRYKRSEFINMAEDYCQRLE